MSNQISDYTDHRAVSAPGGESKPSRSNSALRSPVEPLDGHEDPDHFALIYEDQDEQFATVCPFLREGLERDERCMYIVAENSRGEVLAALRDSGVDVDTALDSGQLSLHTAEETYLAGGDFDIDEARAVLRGTMEEALEEYEGFRVAAEETWLVGDEATQTDFLTCEAHVNDLVDGEECLALCQYNRTELPAAVIDDVLKTHPYLIYDGTICQNVYYTPPEEYFGPANLSRELDRKLETLVDRTDARATVKTREHYQREVSEIMSDSGRTFDEKLDALFEVGCERFDLDLGGMAKVDPDTGLFEVEAISGEHDHLVPEARIDLAETYCRVVADDGAREAVSDPVGITDPEATGFSDEACVAEFGVHTYLGTRLPIQGDLDRTFFFLGEEPRDRGFTETERTFHRLMGQWVQYELERHQRERELRQTKDRFETVFEQSDDGIFVIDPDADEFVDANPAAAEMVGYTRDELLSQSPSDLHPDELEQFRAFLHDVRETGSVWNENLHCRHKNGRDIPAEITASTIMLDGRELVLANVRHIEARKKHERYQQDLYEITADPDLEFETKLERLLELGRDRFSLEMGGLNHLPSWDGKFKLEKGVGPGLESDEELWTDPSNDCYCRRAITEEDPVAMSDVRNTHWTEDAIYREFGLTSYLGTQVTTGSKPYGTLWFGSTEPRDRPFSDAERSFIELMEQWLGYEIERRGHNESQRELYEITADPSLSSDEKIDRLLEAGCDCLDLPVGMLTHEREEAFEIEQMYGTHPDLDEGTLTPPLTDNYCRRVVDTGNSISVADAGSAGWDGDALYHEFDLQCYAGTQVTVDGDAYGTVCFTDTAPREKFTETEQTFLDLLGQCIGYEFERQEYEQELEETIERLQQSNERLEQFAYAASHDLQEPLRMVSSYLQLLEGRYGDAFDEDGEECIEFAVDGADRMREMIDALLEYSRVEKRGDPLEPVELDTVLDDVLEDLQIPIDETGAEITAEPLPCVEGDACQLRQVLQNLLDNALTYSGDEPPQIHIDGEQRGQKRVISVRDDGIGIDPDDQDRVFNIFDRLHSRDEYDGTGIGLALCQRIVERHKGEIWVESEPGEGTTFSFTLPAGEQ